MAWWEKRSFLENNVIQLHVVVYAPPVQTMYAGVVLVELQSELSIARIPACHASVAPFAKHCVVCKLPLLKQ